MKILIFEPSVSGHHLEYLHHYYEGALDRHEENFIFVVSRQFIEIRDKYEWPFANHIHFHYITDECEKRMNERNPYLLGWQTSIVLNKYVRELKPDRVILTMLMQFIPFILFMLPSRVKVRGIMYKIYLYEQRKMTTLRLLIEKFRFWMISISNIIETVFVLNDEKSTSELNKLYHTDKFRYLPDPVPVVNMAKVYDIRQQFGIPTTDKVFLHFGGMDRRKGTLDILAAIISSPQSIAEKTFIFAGKVNDSCRHEFYSMIDHAREKATILVFDTFCSYEFLYNLCYSCDVILMPYKLTSLSSGVLGYAALFGKPVIGPNNGLIGNLIEKYGLGITLKNDCLKTLLESFNMDTYVNGVEYVKINTKQQFINRILF